MILIFPLGKHDLEHLEYSTFELQNFYNYFMWPKYSYLIYTLLNKMWFMYNCGVISLLH